MTADTKAAKKIFDEIGLVPFANDGKQSYQGYLQFLADVPRNSPSLDAVTAAIKTDSFNLPAPRSIDNGFLGTAKDITEQDQARIVAQLEAVGVTGSALSEIAQAIWASIAENGNAWIKIRMAKQLNAAAVSMTVLPTAQMGVGIDKKSGKKYALKIANWNNPDKKDTEVFAYSDSDLIEFESRKGVSETVLHLKYGQGIYGDTPFASVIKHALAEMQVGDYINRELGSDFVSKMLLLFQGDPRMGDIAPPIQQMNPQLSNNPADPYNANLTGTPFNPFPEVEASIQNELQAVTRRLNERMNRKSTTADGVVTMEYANASVNGAPGNPPTAITLPPMTNEKMLITIGDFCTKMVHARAGVSPVLTGIERPTGGINQNSFKDEFGIYASRTVKYWQDVAAGWFRQIFAIFDDGLGTNLAGYTLGFVSPADRFADEQITFNGAQVTSLKEIILAYNKQEITEPQVRGMLKKLFGFNDEEINALL